MSLLYGCSEEPVSKIDLISLWDAGEVRTETREVTFGDDPSIGVLTAGFSMPEKAEKGQTFIWGIGKASRLTPFLFSVENRSLAFSVRHLLIHEVGPQDMQVTWNDSSLGEFRLDHREWRTYTVVVPKQAQVLGDNELVFQFSKTAVPAEVLPNSRDQRRLNVQFDSIVLEREFQPRDEDAALAPYPVVEDRGGKHILRTSVPTDLCWRLKWPKKTRLHIRWKKDSENLDDRAEAVRIVCTTKTDSTVLYEATAGQGDDWAKATLRLPDETDPVELRCQFPSGNVEMRSFQMLLSEHTPVPDLFAVGMEEKGEAGLLPKMEKRPNVIFYLIDSLRADHIGAYGYDRPTTPYLDRFAEEGVLYERCLAHSSWTKPSVASIMTGRHPSSVKMGGKQTAISEDAVLLAETLSDAGYYCVGYSANLFISKVYGFHQGFDEFHQFEERTKSRDVHVLSRELHEKIIHDLDALAKLDKPFFIYIHSLDPHAPYTPPPEFEERFDRGYAGEIEPNLRNLEDARQEKLRLGAEEIRHFIDLYDAEIASQDEAIEDLFDEMKARGLWEESVVVVASDHGEEFLEHGNLEHSRNLHNELVHVPLILRLPNRKKGVRVPDKVRHVDLYPTLVNLCGAEEPLGLEGLVLPGLLGPDKTQTTPRSWFGELEHMGMISREVGDEKVIVNYRQRDFRGRPAPRMELYDVKTDPREKLNLARRTPEESQSLAGPAVVLHRAYLEAGKRLGREKIAEISEETSETLRHLGYLD